MNFRITRTKRLHLIQELHDQFFDEASRLTEDQLKTTYWFIVKCEGKVAGFAGLRICDSSEYGYKLGYLFRVGVLEPYRGQGLQRKLIKARERLAKKLGCTWCVSYTDPTFSRSPNSLIDCGYRLYRPAEFWAGGSPDWLYFRKKLT